jgi:hypothetical protein
MHQKLTANKAYHRRLVKRRSATVEPVLGTLINHHNMRRINSRGMAQARKHVLMAALTYNLKKYMKFTVRKALAQVMALRAIGPRSLGPSTLPAFYACSRQKAHREKSYC